MSTGAEMNVAGAIFPDTALRRRDMPWPIRGGRSMKQLSIDLTNCYGIKDLKAKFDFDACKANAIYAPNGAMKSSLAKTFQDVSEDVPSRDRIFTSRECTRSIKDETGADIDPASILVVRPYDEVLGHSEKTSTLLVNATLRQEYEKLHVDIDVAKDAFLKALKTISGSKRDLEKEISSTFTSDEDGFFRALLRIKDELLAQKSAPFAEVPYDLVFDEKSLAIIGTKDFKTAIAEYIKKYNELLGASTYFKKGMFNYYNATTIAKSLADNGFFKAKHTLNLNADKNIQIADEKELEALIKKEKEGITNDKELRKTFAEIDKLLFKNAGARDFEAYLTEHEDLLPNFANVKKFKEEVWKSYIQTFMDLYLDLLAKFQAAAKRKQQIEEQAAKERTEWEQVIDIFNSRFFVPFKLTAKNRISVILGQEPMLSLGFTFEDGGETVPMERSALIDALSTGEKKALYILNIIFEIQARIKAGQDTLLIVDDIADSFDYKNKYAIIQYLKDIAEEAQFKQIILTHNFDFFRTIQSRFVRYSHCWMAAKNTKGLTLSKASGIQNVFIKDWKKEFFSDPKKRIASIPFIRNLLEFTKGDADADFLQLTALLHWKANSASVKQTDLDGIYDRLFGASGQKAADGGASVVNLVHKSAKECLTADEGINFENKIVLSIAVRLGAEQFMITKIADAEFVAGIEANQTSALVRKFREKFPKSPALDTVHKVMLMTPENIHLNSFMYEPILDMSDDHLRKLYGEIIALA